MAAFDPTTTLEAHSGLLRSGRSLDRKRRLAPTSCRLRRWSMIGGQGTFEMSIPRLLQLSDRPRRFDMFTCAGLRPLLHRGREGRDRRAKLCSGRLGLWRGASPRPHPLYSCRRYRIRCVGHDGTRSQGGCDRGRGHRPGILAQAGSLLAEQRAAGDQFLADVRVRRAAHLRRKRRDARADQGRHPRSSDRARKRVRLYAGSCRFSASLTARNQDGIKGGANFRSANASPVAAWTYDGIDEPHR